MDREIFYGSLQDYIHMPITFLQVLGLQEYITYHIHPNDTNSDSIKTIKRYHIYLLMTKKSALYTN